jgi:predicted RNA-binding Zn-ribbon protein involved in translation (DUF1610 family)
VNGRQFGGESIPQRNGDVAPQIKMLRCFASAVIGSPQTAGIGSTYGVKEEGKWANGGSTMTLHAAPVPSAGKRYFAMPPCPQCGDTLLAPEISEHVSAHEVRHRWSCDACGHEFVTWVDLFRFRRK